MFYCILVILILIRYMISVLWTTYELNICLVFIITSMQKKLLEHQIIMLQSREIHPASGDIQILDWCNTCSWPSNLCALSFVSLCINMYMHCLQIVYTKQGQVWCTAVKLIMFYVQGIAGIQYSDSSQCFFFHVVNI